MKLWKILLATMIALVLVCAVATAEHEHQFNTITTTQTVQIGSNQHATQETTYQICVCGATTSPVSVLKDTTDCTMADRVDLGLTNATCTEGGKVVTACATCGRRGEREVQAKLGHVFNKVVFEAGSCVKKAADVTYCSRCNVEQKEARHEYGYGDHDYKNVYSVEPTCSTNGYYTKVCKVCNKTDGKGDYMVLGDHKWNLVKETAANCTAPKTILESCSVCHGTRTRTEGTVAHDFKWVNPKAPTCGADGYEGYYKCSKCPAMTNFDHVAISEIVVKPALANGHKLEANAFTYIGDCTATNNYMKGTCYVCGASNVTVAIPAKDHSWPAAKNENLIAGTGADATCTKEGYGQVKCYNCPAQKTVTVAATGHDWKAWHYSDAATCTKPMTADRACKNCTATEYVTVAPATGHVWTEVKGTQPTCTTAGKLDRRCAVCKINEYGMTVAALGHDLTKVVEVVKPTCDTKGYTVYGCSRCDVTEKKDYVDALGHNYSWVVVTKPSEAGNGKNEYTCSVCKKVADTKTVKYTKYYYNNTMTSFGPTTKELVGGNDWYRVTPVDVTVDGVYTYDLIASNKYVVGTVTISVNAGTLTVSYKVKGNVDVKDESLLIYASKADLAAGSAVTAPVGAAINVAETFGADGKVLVSLILTGDYDAAGKDLVNDAAAAGMIANID